MAKAKRNSDALNAVERAYTLIFDKAVNFDFLPGERINEVELATSLGMSRAPVREALNRLVAKNLVIFEAGKGFSCRRLSTTEIAELYEIRSELEIAAMKNICGKASDEEIDAFISKWQNFTERHEKLDINTLIDADESFHLELVALAQNSERLAILKNINERIRFVRRIHIASLEQRPVFIDEHERILEAMTNRDTDSVLEIMDKHFAINLTSLKNHINAGLAKIYADEVV